MRFEANLTIAHLNIRREKAGEKRGPLAVDIKLTGKIGTGAFGPLLDGDQHAGAMIEGLFDAEGNLRSHNFQTIPLAMEHKNLAVTLSAGPDKKEFEVSQINSISIDPDIGRTVTVDARLQVNAKGTEIAWLAEMLSYDVRVIAESKQGTLKLDNTGKETAKDAAKRKADKAPEAAAAH